MHQAGRPPVEQGMQVSAMLIAEHCSRRRRNCPESVQLLHRLGACLPRGSWALPWPPPSPLTVTLPHLPLTGSARCWRTSPTRCVPAPLASPNLLRSSASTMNLISGTSSAPRPSRARTMMIATCNGMMEAARCARNSRRASCRGCARRV